MASLGKSIPHYLYCCSTSRVESSHLLSNKYISKQSHSGMPNYRMQKSSCTLDFNENANQERAGEKRTHEWRETFTKRDILYCNTKKKAKTNKQTNK